MRGGWQNRLKNVLEYLGILFFIAFVLTASFSLFFKGIELPEEAIRKSALLTFANALFIAFIVFLIGKVYKRIMVDRPVERISEGLQKLTEGRFSETIEPFPDPLHGNQYNRIIEQINKMAGELQGVETLRTDFVSNVSHEMKTPLSVIQNYAVLLRTPEISAEDRTAYAQAIIDATKRLSTLITNILKLNKLENQQIFSENQRINVSEQICTCLLEFETAWEQKNLEIETDIEEEIYIEADPELLSIVWNNLFSNAIKFTEQGGVVSVSARRKKDQVIVSVSDTGCGIDSETGKHIFDKFYQGDTSHASLGNGLGLALVKRIIDITGGEIQVSSEVGKGSTFTVILSEKTKEALESQGNP